MATQDLDQLSRDQLIEHVKEQNKLIEKLKNQIDRRDQPNQCKDQSNQRVSKGRPFDFSKIDKKHVALKFFYLGWNYDGFVEQENTTNTIEYHVFDALKKACLIESRETSNYNRCGRTDKGVSAYSQVISLDLRSKRSSTTGEEQVCYCKMLNSLLPKDIRCVCSAEVNSEFSARFNCKSRTYKYFFPLGTLDLEAMRKACQYFEGEHDFRNFCKLDKTKLNTNYTRSVESAKITQFSVGLQTCYDIYVLEIKSTAFLWHQIRCIVAVLFCIGERREEPELVIEMFDLTKFSKKPQYPLAHELPLILFDCEFEIDNWYYDKEAIREAVASLNDCFIESSIRNAICLSMLQDLEQRGNTIDHQFQKYFTKDLRIRNHKKFKDRPYSDMQLNDGQKTKITKKLEQRSIDDERTESDFKKLKKNPIETE